MGKQKYAVNLNEQEVRQLTKVIRAGKRSAHEILHANILLAVNDKTKPNVSHAKIAAMYQTSAVNGLTAALQRKERKLRRMERSNSG